MLTTRGSWWPRGLEPRVAERLSSQFASQHSPSFPWVPVPSRGRDGDETWTGVVISSHRSARDSLSRLTSLQRRPIDRRSDLARHVRSLPWLTTMNSRIAYVNCSAAKPICRRGRCSVGSPFSSEATWPSQQVARAACWFVSTQRSQKRSSPRRTLASWRCAADGCRDGCELTRMMCAPRASSRSGLGSALGTPARYPRSDRPTEPAQGQARAPPLMGTALANERRGWHVDGITGLPAVLLVGPRGLEPRTCGLRVRCSARLS
jgi:hypothetical protein